MWTITELPGNLIEFSFAGTFPRTEVLPKASYSLTLVGNSVVIANATNPAIVEYRLRPANVSAVVDIEAAEIDIFADAAALKAALDAVWLIRTDAGGGFPLEYDDETATLQIAAVNGLSIALRDVAGVPSARVSFADLVTAIKNGSGSGYTYYLKDDVKGVEVSNADPELAAITYDDVDFGVSPTRAVAVRIFDDLIDSGYVDTYVIISDPDGLVGAP